MALDWSGAAEDLLGDGYRGERLRPAGVDRGVGDRLDHFSFGGAILPRQVEVVGELLGVASGDQARDGGQAALLG